MIWLPSLAMYMIDWHSMCLFCSFQLNKFELNWVIIKEVWKLRTFHYYRLLLKIQFCYHSKTFSSILLVLLQSIFLIEYIYLWQPWLKIKNTKDERHHLYLIILSYFHRFTSSFFSLIDLEVSGCFPFCYFFFFSSQQLNSCTLRLLLIDQSTSKHIHWTLSPLNTDTAYL